QISIVEKCGFFTENLGFRRRISLIPGDKLQPEKCWKGGWPLGIAKFCSLNNYSKKQAYKLAMLMLIGLNGIGKPILTWKSNYIVQRIYGLTSSATV
ncbi:TPA: hypothetical protein ACXHW4_004716, partial [Enterobacter hormaechei]